VRGFGSDHRITRDYPIFPLGFLRASVSPMNNVYSKVVLAGFRQPG
jgi:hypothetical protein